MEWKTHEVFRIIEKREKENVIFTYEINNNKRKVREDTSMFKSYGRQS